MEPALAIEYRMGRKFRNIGILCTLFAVTCGSFSTFVAYFNVDGSFPRPKLAALLFALGWSTMALLGIWLWRIYYKYKMLVDAHSLRQQGMWRSQKMEFSEVREIRWYLYPAGGSVLLTSSHHKMKVEFGNFSWTDRDEFISFLLSAIPAERHVAYEKFCQHFTPTPVRQSRAKLAKLVLFIVFVFHAAFFGWLGFINRDIRYLVTAVINFAIAIYLARHSMRDTVCEIRYRV
jgi:hypothetical protein